MRPSLFLLPFLALLTLTAGFTLNSVFLDIPWIETCAWGSFFVLIAIWLALDWAGFVAFFTRRGTRHGLSSGVSMLLVILTLLGVGSLASRDRSDKSFDLTDNKLHTLSPQSRNVIQVLNEKQDKLPIRARAYFVDASTETTFRSLLRHYVEAGLNIEVTFLDPQIQVTKAKADKVTEQHMVVLEGLNREARFSTFNEERMTAALVSLLASHKKVTYFLNGHGEGSLSSEEGEGLSSAKKAMEDSAYEVKSLTFSETAHIPEDADLLLLVGPQFNLPHKEISALAAYLQKGGSLLVLVDAVRPTDSLEGLLAKYGLVVHSDFIALKPEDPRIKLLGQNTAIISEFPSPHPIADSLTAQGNATLNVTDTRTVEATGVETSTIAKTSPSNIRIKNVFSEEDLKDIVGDRIEQGSFPFLVEAKISTESGKAGHLLVGGSSKFVVNQGLSYGNHRDFFLNIVNYLLHDDPLLAKRPESLNKKASHLEITSASSVYALMVLCFLYPLFFLLGGLFVWLRRKNA